MGKHHQQSPMRDDASTKPSPLFRQNVVQVIPSLRHPGHHGVSRIQTARHSRVTTLIPRYLDGPSILANVCVHQSVYKASNRTSLLFPNRPHLGRWWGVCVWVTSLSLPPPLLRIPLPESPLPRPWTPNPGKGIILTSPRCPPLHRAPAATGTWTPPCDFSPLLQIVLTPEWLPSHSIGLGNLGREWAKRKIYSYDKQSAEKRSTKIPTTRIPIPTQQHDKADNRSWKLLKEIKATSYDVPSQLARQQWKVGTHL